MAKGLVAVVGGGAAGIMSAICLARVGCPVVLCERLDQLGKKVLASGGGRCNFSNVSLDPSFFHEEDRPFVEGVLNRFGKKEIDEFFRELGLWSYAGEDGRMFPISNRSATVMDVLKDELERLKIQIEYGFDADVIQKSQNGFELRSKSGKKIFAEKVVLCAGGKTYPALGSDGSGYALAAAFGHTIIAPVPITLPIVVKDPWCHLLQGQKVKARAASRVDGMEGEWLLGDVLFTKYGLSGTAIFDCTDAVSLALNRTKDARQVEVVVDFVPFMSEEELFREFERKLAHGFKASQLIDGILSPKFGLVLKDYLKTDRTRELAKLLKKRAFKVEATRGWNEAEFTAGGVAIDEVNSQTLESKKQPGLFFAGEILNVQGRRGGYNLAWAWASGAVIGQ
ncbi:MAG: aminoacetone oxidase family FAD-binding enzyme [Candidatus Omnitrophota bacterium]|nr:aminoacetone oxidase family FAD-binding enzyme [Candidatus Omnitrophota bacterium]